MMLSSFAFHQTFLTSPLFFFAVLGELRAATIQLPSLGRNVRRKRNLRKYYSLYVLLYGLSNWRALGCIKSGAFAPKTSATQFTL